MRYADFYDCDLCNGNAIGVSLFVQGCPLHCKGCFNPSTWSFSGGKPWTDASEEKFFDYIKRPYIKRVSFLGGSPLAEGNRDEVLRLCKKIKTDLPWISIWVYTGFTWEELSMDPGIMDGLKFVDILVDGRYIDTLKDLSLPFRGSSNQRIIDVQKSLQSGGVILW